MFDCKTCETLSDEVKFLREQLKAMTDRLVALTNPLALQVLSPLPQYNPDDFHGTSQMDEMIEYDDYGQRILKKRIDS